MSEPTARPGRSSSPRSPAPTCMTSTRCLSCWRERRSACTATAATRGAQTSSMRRRRTHATSPAGVCASPTATTNPNGRATAPRAEPALGSSNRSSCSSCCGGSQRCATGPDQDRQPRVHDTGAGQPVMAARHVPKGRQRPLPAASSGSHPECPRHCRGWIPARRSRRHPAKKGVRSRPTACYL